MVSTKTRRVRSKSPSAELAEFIAPYSPEIASRARAVLAKMRKLLPGAFELVYDQYNGLVIGFGPSERASEAIFSIVLYPRWVTLFFLKGAKVSDPERLLRGSGTTVRHIVLHGPEVLDQPSVKALIVKALRGADSSLVLHQPRRIVVKGRAPKRRPRRPAGSQRAMRKRN
jgi:hypothetical protein